jgi:hypothetical protein
MRIAPLGILTSLAIAACGTDVKVVEFQPDPPSVYVAKVKNILVGMPPTDAEVQAVVKDPNALGGLVDGWMQTQQYTDKMMVFFELAFQQTQITSNNFVDNIPPRGLGINRMNAQLVQNIRESFARTVLYLQQNGGKFTDAFTTKTIMMTPAMMELYAYLDSRHVDDKGVTSDQFAKANLGKLITINATGTSNPAALIFVNPDLPNLKYPNDTTCEGMTSISFVANADDMHDVMLGGVPQHKNPTGVNDCTVRVTLTTAGAQLNQPGDFTTWRPVQIRQPVGAEATTSFNDVNVLRNAPTLVVNTKHQGFYSTPAFQANWPTNSSNQMRVTLNQTLIVATGQSIDGTDATQPTNTAGLDTVHASDAACVGCHQQLDTTRSILTATYSYFYYPQTDTNLMNIPGQFTFQGVVQQMKTIDDFGGLLASHPLVPQAWAQKLCYYVNSEACDPSDPELQRIVANFAKNGMWNGLVKDIVTSPLTTNASETETFKLSGTVVAVSRRDHLCAALNNRLGFNDICQLDATYGNRAQSTVGQIVSGMPSDGYGRGSMIPVLPNQPTLFYRAGLENICEQVSQAVIDAKPDPLQPNAKNWSSSNATQAISDFVSLVMAIEPSDSRSAALTGALTDHFTAAKATGASASDSLKSTFVAACLAPSFIGIGM